MPFGRYEGTLIAGLPVITSMGSPEKVSRGPDRATAVAHAGRLPGRFSFTLFGRLTVGLLWPTSSGTNMRSSG
ncbi:hypothetical protein [Modicisalibacter ilicicola]|uniref:hypothetical protein n=1 Tax=Modicisalibacter ilicicola TaxID=480814 RepID=UPI0035302BF2